MRETIPAHGPCEIRTLLAGVLAWERCKYDLGGEWETYERHHAYGQRWHDEPWAVLNVCRPAHRFEDEVWGKAGFVVCLVALKRRGDFDERRAFETYGWSPLGKVSNWLTSGAFASEPVLIRFCEELLGEAR